MAKWMVAAKKADFVEIGQKYGISQITARLIRNRDIVSDDQIEMYLKGNISMLHDPYSLKDIEKAAEIIKTAIIEGKKIRIIGDYDVDGITSTFILHSGLKMCNANVDYVLPHRIVDGYGLNNNLVKNAHDDGINVILTCDNGIAAAEQVKYAKELNMTVVVTDHHEVPFDTVDGENIEILPPADAVVDPKQKDCKYPYKEICGAVVAYKFIQVLIDKFRDDESQNLAQIDDSMTDDLFNEIIVFAGLGTVCDVMPLCDENRIIVKESLKRIGSIHNKGLHALISINGLDENSMSCYHFGFIIGPCLNATGRLDSAERALKLLQITTDAEAMLIASELKELNDSRKDLTEKGVKTASMYVQDNFDKVPDVIVIYLPDSHESVAGIIAGKVREKYNRPSLVITNGSDGICKGSGRSTENYDMYTEMSKCKDLFTKFGGHKMAAGFSLLQENIDELRDRLNEYCTLTEEDFIPVEHIDMVMPLQYATNELVKEFELLEPFGNGNKKPLFADRNIRLISGRIMGKNRNCGKYKVVDANGRSYEMIYFGDMEKWTEFLNENFGRDNTDRLYEGTLRDDMSINIAYIPDINVYRGYENLQIIMQDYMAIK
jgi:single-stranded-DNA-specific exonuclease